ncbi:MAG: S9 family peptidase [Bacteroidales bacterium]|nr:S9 family peptidase [Bacteroidales bacterium]MCB9013959.1 S9 family peptidase [Bacteroidales bacterium]
MQCTSKNSLPKPPLAQVNPVEDDYFGIKITDPYRYMENLQDSNVVNWIKEQSDYSRKILNSIPGRQKLIDEMTDFDNRLSEKINSLIITENDRYFYLKSTPNDETGKVFYRDSLNGKETLLFDPETYGTDSTQKYVISSMSPSYDGTKLSFEVAANGSESSELFVMDVNTGNLYPEKIDRCWFTSASWLPDGSGFIYNRLNSSDVHDINREKDSKVYLHIMGTDVKTDRELFSRSTYPDLGMKSEDVPIVEYRKSSNLLFAYITSVDNRLNVFYAPYTELTKKHIDWKRLIAPGDEVYDFSTTDKDIYYYTPKGAPNYKILKASLDNPTPENAVTVVPEDAGRSLTSYAITKDGLFYTLSENGIREILEFIPAGETAAKEIKLPFEAGSIGLGNKGYKFSDIWVTIAGWSSDFQRYRYDAQKNLFSLENLSSKAQYPEFANLTVEEVMVPSHDGVMVPLSLIYNKDLKRDGKNPVLIFGYGAYGSSMNPFFSPQFLTWTMENGILAVAHVRGGGELGDQWHKAGFKTTKPNTWKDLIACAEYIIKENYTSPKKIAIYSASAGGILIGRAMTERPDLFAAAIPGVGVMNPLRVEESPNGPVNTPEFGTVKDSVECMAIIEMDSYHHVENGVNYPATLITAGMNDPRVIAWQPAKFAARLQAANVSDKPILFWADFDAGHGIGNTKTKAFESMADVFAFGLWQCGVKGFQPE